MPRVYDVSCFLCLRCKLGGVRVGYYQNVRCSHSVSKVPANWNRLDSIQYDSVIGGENLNDSNSAERSRLSLPIGMCMTSSLPIIGAMETMLFRLCNELGSTRDSVTVESVTASNRKMIYEYLNHALFTFQRPIRGPFNSAFHLSTLSTTTHRTSCSSAWSG
jgi:hypothetical protein